MLFGNPSLKTFSPSPASMGTPSISSCCTSARQRNYRIAEGSDQLDRPARLKVRPWRDGSVMLRELLAIRKREAQGLYQPHTRPDTGMEPDLGAIEPTHSWWRISQAHALALASSLNSLRTIMPLRIADAQSPLWHRRRVPAA